MTNNGLRGLTPAVNSLRLSTRIGCIFLGLVVALAVAWIAVELRQRATQGPDALASSGMYAFGDLVLGVGVFGVLALVPMALTLYWLRPVARFWSALQWGAILFALTGCLAVAASIWALQSRSAWLILAHARIGLMPLGALALLMCTVFAPQARQRWLLLATAIGDGALFAAIVISMLVRSR